MSDDVLERVATKPPRQLVIEWMRAHMRIPACRARSPHVHGLLEKKTRGRSGRRIQLEVLASLDHRAHRAVVALLAILEIDFGKVDLDLVRRQYVVDLAAAVAQLRERHVAERAERRHQPAFERSRQELLLALARLAADELGTGDVITGHIRNSFGEALFDTIRNSKSFISTFPAPQPLPKPQRPEFSSAHCQLWI